MVVIREFETMLNEIKTKGEYNGVAYNHPGPAHLSIGQEAAAVGMAYTLGLKILFLVRTVPTAKSWQKDFQPFDKLSDEQLTEVMENHFDGKTFAPCKNELQRNDQRIWPSAF